MGLVERAARQLRPSFLLSGFQSRPSGRPNLSNREAPVPGWAQGRLSRPFAVMAKEAPHTEP